MILKITRCSICCFYKIRSLITFYVSTKSEFYRNCTKISFIPFCFFFCSKITFAQILGNFKNTFHFNENITHRERKINSWIFFPWWKIDAHKSTIVFNRLIGSETTLIISTPYLSPCLFVWTRTYSYYENVQHFSQKQVYKNTTIIIIFPKKRSMPFYVSVRFR